MTKLSAEEIRKVWETEPDRLVRAFRITLRDFGYTSLTDLYVKEEVQRLMDGGEPKGGPSMFIAGWLKDGIE